MEQLRRKPPEPLEIVEYRRWLTDESSIGELQIGEDFSCYTLEDRLRAPGVKVYGKTAIPAGRYKVLITRSPHFSERASKRAGKPIDVFLPILLNVPRFTGIRIHGGNDAEDTQGCILVGYHRGPNRVSNCALALKEIKRRISKAKEAYLTIVDEPYEDTRTDDADE